MTHRDGFPRLSASTRVAWRCGTSVATCPVSKLWAARKPWEAAVPVGQANRQRANRCGRRKALPMCPASPAASLLPGGSLARSLWVIINAPWYNVLFRKKSSWIKPVGEERHMPNPATVRERRLRKTKAQPIDEIDTLERRAAAIEAHL